MPDSAPPRDYDLDVSVIIPALELTDAFAHWVRLLAAQEPGFSFEVLVVLNHEERAIEAAFPERVRVLFCETPGAFAARNMGIAGARGRVLAFTDSDITPDARWLAEGYTAVETTSFNMLVAGRVTPYHEHRNAVAVYEGAFYFQQERYVADGGFAGSANLWVPAHIVSRIGPFDERVRGVADVEFCWRAAAAGFGLAYAESAVVYHPTRASLRDLLLKERRTAGGHVMLRKSGPVGKREAPSLRDEVRFFNARRRAAGDAYPLPGGWRLQCVAAAVFCVRVVEKLLVMVGKKPVPH